MKKEWKAVIAANAAGIGLASGRTVMMFYSQMEKASWLGVAAAAALFGVLCAGACTLARKTGRRTLADAAMSLFGIWFGMFVGVVYSLAAAVVAIAVLSEAGRMAALVLPVRHAQEMGILCALGIALMLNVNGMKRYLKFGAAAIVVCVLFYAGISLDPRPVQLWRRIETVAKLSGSVPAALVLACLHASLCALIAADSVMKRTGEAKDFVIFSLRCSGIMLLILLAANGAMLRGGTELLSMKYPEAVLSARWGSVGFYLCVFSMAVRDIATLSACIGIITGLNAKHDKNPC